MAYDFDGSGDHIALTKGASAIDLSVLSYSFHVAQDATGTYREIFWMGGAWPSNFHSFCQEDGGGWGLTFKSGCTTGTQHGAWSIGNAGDTAWHNRVITYDYTSVSNDPLSYLDGVSQTVTERATPTGSPRYSEDTSNLRLGAYSDGSAEYWDGRIAEFAIWNRILTAAEAAILGDGFSPAFIPNGLVFYAPMIRGLQDLKSGNVGTATNAVVYPHPRIIYPTGGL